MTSGSTSLRRVNWPSAPGSATGCGSASVRRTSRAWSLSTAVELGRGPGAAEAIEQTSGYTEGLETADRRAALHFDLRASAGRGRPRHAGPADLDTADRIALQRIRHDPLARELVPRWTARRGCVCGNWRA